MESAAVCGLFMALSVLPFKHQEYGHVAPEPFYDVTADFFRGDIRPGEDGGRGDIFFGVAVTFLPDDGDTIGGKNFHGN